MHRRRHYFGSREDEGEELIRKTGHISNIIPPKLLLNHSLFAKTLKGLAIHKSDARSKISGSTTFKNNLRGITLGLWPVRVVNSLSYLSFGLFFPYHYEQQSKAP